MKDFWIAASRLYDRLVLWLATRYECGGNCFTCPYFNECEEDFYADGE